MLVDFAALLSVSPMNTHIHCQNHQLHGGEIMMDVCGRVGFFFFFLSPLSSYQPEAAATGIRAAVLSSSVLFFFPFLILMQTEFPFLWSYFSWKNLTLWGCQTWLRSGDTALSILSFAGNYRRIVNLVCHLLFCKGLIHLWPLTCWKNSDPSSTETSGTPSLRMYIQ